MCWAIVAYACNKTGCESTWQKDLYYDQNCGKDLMNHYPQDEPRQSFFYKLCDHCTGQAIERANIFWQRGADSQTQTMTSASDDSRANAEFMPSTVPQSNPSTESVPTGVRKTALESIHPQEHTIASTSRRGAAAPADSPMSTIQSEILPEQHELPEYKNREGSTSLLSLQDPDREPSPNSFAFPIRPSSKSSRSSSPELPGLSLP